MKERNPLSQAEKGFTRRALNKGGYDPRSVLRWGQMMAISLLEVVKAVEKRFGEEGQEVCTEALVNVGRQVGKGILEAATIPQGLSEIEKISFLASWVNRNVYASPDVPKIISVENVPSTSSGFPIRTSTRRETVEFKGILWKESWIALTPKTTT
jgi:hypothetical protein